MHKSLWVMRILLCFAVLCTACTESESTATSSSGTGGKTTGAGGGSQSTSSSGNGGAGGDPVGSGGNGGTGGSAGPPCMQWQDLAKANVDIPTITLTGAITINGKEPTTIDRTSIVELRNPNSGDHARLGVVGDPTYTTKQVIPGLYDIYYKWSSTDSQDFPRNEGVRLKSGVDLSNSQTYNLDIPTITLSGAITVNGVEPTTIDRTSTVELRNEVTGDRVRLGVVGDPTYTPKQIVPGTYDVYYRWSSTDFQDLPRNQGVRIKSGVSLTSSQTFNIDIPTVTLNGAITINGLEPNTSNQATIVELRNDATGDRVRLGIVGEPKYTTKQIVPGTYDVYYKWSPTDLQDLPRNEGVRVKSGVNLTSSQTFNVDIPTITLNGAITINGLEPNTSNQKTTVELRNGTTGDRVKLGIVGEPKYTTKQIVPGTYDVYYHWDQGDLPDLPRNEGVRIKSGVSLTSSQTFNVDMTTITLSGAITINGLEPTTINQTSRVELRNQGTGDVVKLGIVGEPKYVTKQIIPGTYDVFYRWSTSDAQELPRNEGARVKVGVALTSTQTFNVDIPAKTLSGAITINGVEPNTNDMTTTVRLKNIGTGDSLLFGRVGLPTYDTKQIIPGTYDVYYLWSLSDSQDLPRNENGRVGCVIIPQ